MSDVRVSVLMSTYNGEKFIREQLESILHQKNVDVQLLIRDDGSTDSTIEIIHGYADRYQNVSAYEGKNVGVGKSFMELVSKAPDAEYYAFADQDDVWLEDKLTRAVNVIRKAEHSSYSDLMRGTGKPVLRADLNRYPSIERQEELAVLYGSNQTLVDTELNTIGLRFDDTPNCDLYSTIMGNMIAGCTMVMNNSLKEKICAVPLPEERIIQVKIHDTWVLYCSFIMGVFVYDEESRMLYRQHGNNVVGVQHLTGMGKIKDKLKRLSSQKYKGIRSTLARNMLERLSDEMNQDLKNELELLQDANSLIGAVSVCRDAEWSKAIPESKWKFVLRGIMKWI